MRKLILLFFCCATLLLSSCQPMDAILQVGVGAAILIALIVMFVIVWVVSLLKGEVE